MHRREISAFVAHLIMQPSTAIPFRGTVWLYNTNMTAQNIDINATNTNATVGDSYLYGDALYGR